MTPRMLRRIPFRICTVILGITSSTGAFFHDLNLRADVEHAPFIHGVGSADPLTDSVLIWTRVSQASIHQVQWRIWEKHNQSQSFESALQSGAVAISQESDYTTTIEVNNLRPGTTYNYQFLTPVGRRSVMGTTKTASASSTEVNIVTLSCTSLWSGYFNMYRHIAQNDALDVVIHLGDIIYSEIDPDEMYRVPYGLCEDWAWFQPSTLGGTADDNHDASVRDLVATLRCSNMTNLERYRWIHNLYLLDPDLRAARASHPWIVALDNHDLVGYSADPKEGSRRAALEWIPQRVTIEKTEQGDSFAKSLRSFRFGDDLVDVIMLDTHSFATSTGLLGDRQHQWLNQALLNSTVADWRVFGSGKTFMPFTLNKLATAIAMPCFLVTLILATLLLTCVFSELGLFTHTSHYEIIHTHEKETTLVIEEDGEDDEKERQDDVFKEDTFETAKMAHHHSLYALSRCSSFGVFCFLLWLCLWIPASFFLHDLVNPETGGLTFLNAHEYTWEGQPSCDTRFFDQLEATKTDGNNFWATGDMHFSYAADVIRYNPYGKDLLDYKPELASGVKRYGVEMIGGSGTRGNIDEKLGEFSPLLLPGTLLSRIVNPMVNHVISSMNSHFRFFDGQQHGYGMVKIARTSMEAQFYQFPILRKTDDFHVGKTMRVESGKNQWSKG